MSDELREAALEYHRLPTPGKISVTATKPLATQRDLALAYSPGVAYACELIRDNPAEAAAVYAPYGKASVEQLTAMLKSHTHHHHPTGANLRQEIVAYAEELKQVDVLRATTDPAKFADRIYADVLT